jgi:hypothetical protein
MLRGIVCALPVCVFHTFHPCFLAGRIFLSLFTHFAIFHTFFQSAHQNIWIWMLTNNEATLRHMHQIISNNDNTPICQTTHHDTKTRGSSAQLSKLLFFFNPHETWGSGRARCHLAVILYPPTPTVQ